MEHLIHFSRNSALPKSAADRLTFESAFVVTVRPGERAVAGRLTDNTTYESLEALAFVCGFEAYRELSKDKNDTSRRPTPLDEDLSPEQLKERRAYQADRLQTWFERHAPGFGVRLDCLELINRWQPTARHWDEDATVHIEGNEHEFVAACERLISSGQASGRELALLKAGLRHGAEALLPGSVKLIRTACVALESSREGERKRLGTELLEALAANGDALARAYYAMRLNDCEDYEAALKHAQGRPGDDVLVPELRAALVVQEARARLTFAYRERKSIRQEMPQQQQAVLEKKSDRELRRAHEALAALCEEHFETPEATGEWLTWLTVANFVCSYPPEGYEAHISKVLELFRQITEKYGNRHAQEFYAALMKKRASRSGKEDQT